VCGDADERPEQRGLIEGISGLIARDGGEEELGERFGDGFFDEDAGGGVASLTGSEAHAIGGALGCEREVGIGANDEGIFSAEFEGEDFRGVGGNVAGE
jgi:hypothetical protein